MPLRPILRPVPLSLALLALAAAPAAAQTGGSGPGATGPSASQPGSGDPAAAGVCRPTRTPRLRCPDLILRLPYQRYFRRSGSRILYHAVPA